MIKVTNAAEEHLDDILKIENESFTDPWTREAFASALSVPENIFLCALSDGETAGYIIGTAIGEYASVDNVGVSPAQRRNGIGTMLLRVFEARARDGGISSKVSLEVREGNVPAVGLYKKCGYAEIGVRKNFYENPRENAVVMSKELSSPVCCKGE